MNMLKEFKEFAVRGNVVDMAVGIIVGVAFGKIVTSLVGDVIMPPVGLLVGGIDFTDLSLVLKDAADGSPAVAVCYGRFMQTVVDFIIVAFAVFMLVKGINALKRAPAQGAPAPPEPSREEMLLAEIRDVLRDKRQGTA